MSFLSGHNISSVACAAMLPFGTLLHQPAPTEVIYKHTASGDLKMFCFQPAGAKTSKARPAALWIHGGGWTGGTCESFFPMARYTATRGAASFVVEYRLAKTNGTVTVADCVADCKSAVRYLRSHAAELAIDPHRIAVHRRIGGRSSGRVRRHARRLRRPGGRLENQRAARCAGALQSAHPIRGIQFSKTVRQRAREGQRQISCANFRRRCTLAPDSLRRFVFTALRTRRFRPTTRANLPMP